MKNTEAAPLYDRPSAIDKFRPRLNALNLERAKTFRNTENRKWKKSSTVVMYKDSAPVTLYVLEGTPPRGFIVAIENSVGYSSFHRLDNDLKRLKTFHPDGGQS